MYLEEVVKMHPLGLTIEGGELVAECVRLPFRATLYYQDRVYEVPEEFLDKKTTLDSLLKALFADVSPALYTEHIDEIENFIAFCKDTGSILSDYAAEEAEKHDFTHPIAIPSELHILQALRSFRYGQKLYSDLRVFFGDDYELFACADYAH